MTHKDNPNFQDQVDVPETDTAKPQQAQTPEQALQYNGAPVWKRNSQQLAISWVVCLCVQ